MRWGRKRTWRVSLPGLLSGMLFIVTAFGISVAVADGVIRRGLAAGHGIVAVFAGGMAAGAFAMAWRPSVTLTESHLVIRNPLRKYRIDLLDVVEVSAGYGGLTIVTRSQGEVGAWAVQKSNLASWFDAYTRADAVCETITAAVADCQAQISQPAEATGRRTRRRQRAPGCSGPDASASLRHGA